MKRHQSVIKKIAFGYSKTKSNNFDNRENDAENSREIVKLYYFFLFFKSRVRECIEYTMEILAYLQSVSGVYEEVIVIGPPG